VTTYVGALVDAGVQYVIVNGDAETIGLVADSVMPRFQGA
jgi:hypothetical protein